MAQPMDDAMNKQERAVAIADSTNTKQHNEVMMAVTSLGLIDCIDWVCTLITTPQGHMPQCCTHAGKGKMGALQ